MQYRNIDKQALKENGYTVLSKITIVGTDTVFTEDDHIVDWTYEDYRYVPNNGFIGQFVERILDGNLQDISEEVVLEDTEINLQLGIVNALDNNTTTWYDYGNFLITKVEKTDTTGNYKFESADYTKKFNKVFDGDYTDTTYTKSFNQKIEDEETVTALWLAQYVCAQAGVLLNDTNFTNYDFVISSNQYDSGDTLRKVMQDIGKLAYSWVRVGEDNKVHIDFTPKATSSVDQYDQLTTDEYYVSKKSDLAFGPVNKVLIGMSDVEGENMYETSPDYTEETECAIKIYDNNLTNTEELRALALDGCDRLFGLTYTPIEINSVGHPWLDGDELIKLTNVDGEIIYTYPFNRKISYAGYIEGTIGAEAQTAQESKYEYKSDIISDVKKTSFIVDKQEQTITGLVENMNDIILETTVKKTEEGNPIEIYDAGSYPVEDFKIYGNAIQDGTPSVQNPVEIQTLTSKVEEDEYSGTNIEFYNDTYNYSITNDYILEGNTSQVQYTGKNKLHQDQYITTRTTNGITYTNNGDGTFNITGTATANTSINILTGASQVELESGKTYYLYSSQPYNNQTFNMSIPFKQNGTQKYLTANNSITTSGTLTDIKLSFYTNSGNTINAQNVKLMLVEGSTPGEYEPYVGGTASPNPSFPEPINTVTGLQKIEVCGKNYANPNDFVFYNPSYASVSYENNIATLTTLQTKSNNDLFFCTKIPDELLVNGQTYTISSVNVEGVYQDLKLQLRNKNGSYVSGKTPDYTRTYDSNYSLYIVGNPFASSNVSVPSGSVCKIKDIMLNIGSTATTYEPYIGNTYEINLGKNLYEGSQDFSGTWGNSNAWETDSQTYNGLVVKKRANAWNGLYKEINITSGKTYYFSFYAKSDISRSIGVYLTGGTGNMTPQNASYDTTTNWTRYSIRFTATTTGTIRARVENKTTIADSYLYICGYQLEESDSLTSYSPYFEPIFLGGIGNHEDLIFKGKGINLFDKNNVRAGYRLTDSGYYADNGYNATEFIGVKPSTTYSTSWTIDWSECVCTYDINQTFVRRIMSGTGFTTSGTEYYIRADVKDGHLSTAQINEGNQVLPYEPYNAKDKWLLHKEIGKLILGNANYIYTSSNKRFYNTFSDINLFTPTDTSRHAEYIKSNCFYNSTTDADGSLFQYQNQLIMHNYSYTDTTNFKNWLSSVNAYLYYVLQNPTTTEITNEELINQLNSIELLDGLNNIIITSSNLPGILNINQTKYPYQIIRIKDNIGIYNDYKLILKDVEYARVTDNCDYIYPENDKWYSYKIINKINSYNGETIDTDYISTTGELSTGATVYYVADEPNIQEIVDENILTPLNDLKNTLLYNGYNKIELLNELVDKLSITYLTDSELNASYATKSELQITANNITSTVSETTTKVNELDEKIEEVNASISEQTSTSITDWFNTSLKSLIEDLETSTNNNSNEIINIQSYIRRGRITDVTSPYYNQAYIELGDSTNQTTLRILQNRIQFLTNGEETAYISNNQLYINESTILTKEKIGHWVTTEDEDGLLNTYWEE